MISNNTGLQRKLHTQISSLPLPAAPPAASNGSLMLLSIIRKNTAIRKDKISGRSCIIIVDYHEEIPSAQAIPTTSYPFSVTA